MDSQDDDWLLPEPEAPKPTRPQQPLMAPTSTTVEDRGFWSSLPRVIISAVVLIVLVAGAFALGRATAPEESQTTATAPPNASADELLTAALDAHASGDLDGATEIYEQVLSLDSSNKYAHYNLGLIDQTNGDLDAAIERYEEALTNDPAYGPALYNVGLAYAATGDRDTAIERLRSALAVNDQNPSTMFNLGLLLVDAGEVEEGNQLLQQANELDPSLTIPS
jgi:tetratricopeptide (TPR) repeat protein